jgi:hypothetical protein
MMTKLSFFLVALLAVACGDNLKPNTNDSGVADGSGGGFPAAPTLGVQVDRMARPAINTALNHGFDPTPAAGTAKDAYNQDGSPGGWQAAYVAQFAGNLAVLDALDTGITCVNGTCGPATVPTAGDGCGNQVEYNGQIGGGGTPAADSYTTLAGLLANDELFLDTTKAMCDLPNHQNYLGVEFNVLTSAGGVTCGGREPHNDVIDTSYAALAIGLNGFNNSTFTPAFGDGVGPHTDLLDAFPYLGPPHT